VRWDASVFPPLLFDFLVAQSEEIERLRRAAPPQQQQQQQQQQQPPPASFIPPPFSSSTLPDAANESFLYDAGYAAASLAPPSQSLQPLPASPGRPQVPSAASSVPRGLGGGASAADSAHAPSPGRATLGRSSAPASTTSAASSGSGSAASAASAGSAARAWEGGGGAADGGAAAAASAPPGTGLTHSQSGPPQPQGAGAGSLKRHREVNLLQPQRSSGARPRRGP
jgi:hypothetical protein